jgi:DNA-nicking Smr family endonuclease
MLFATQKMHKIRQPEEADVRIHTPKFYQETYFQSNDFFDEKALIVPIYQNNKLAQAIQELSENGIQGNKDATPTHRQPQQKVKKSDKEVVDLHLFELIEDDKGMTPKEKLDYQMKVFREKLEENIHDPHVRKVIFIHGKGNGRLKMEIRKCLDQNYKRYEYQDASFEEYGGGATLVYVK